MKKKDEEFIARMNICAKRVGSVNALAKKADISQGGIRKYFSGGEPTRPALSAIANAAGVSLQWLATGEGQEGGAPQSFIAEPSAEYAVNRRADDRYAAIPLYDVHVAAGGGVIVNQEQVVDALHFRRDWIRAELHVSPEDLCLVYVQGDSMQPTLDPGDMILINHHDQRAERDGIYVLRLEGALLVKRLQRLPGGVLQVVSDNPAYQPYQLKLNELEGFDVAIVGRVVWVGRRM